MPSIKTHGRVSTAKEVMWHTSVLFTGTAKFKTHGRVSAAKEVMWHTSVLFTGTAKSPFSTPHISITTGPISIKFTYFMPSIKTHGRVSTAKEVMWHTSVLFTGTAKFKTHGRVSAAKEVMWHTSVLFTGTAKSPFSTPHITTLHTKFEENRLSSL